MTADERVEFGLDAEPEVEREPEPELEPEPEETEHLPEASGEATGSTPVDSPETAEETSKPLTFAHFCVWNTTRDDLACSFSFTTEAAARRRGWLPRFRQLPKDTSGYNLDEDPENMK